MVTALPSRADLRRLCQHSVDAWVPYQTAAGVFFANVGTPFPKADKGPFATVQAGLAAIIPEIVRADA